MAIYEDSSTPAALQVQSNTTGVVTCATFSPPANSLIVVIVSNTRSAFSVSSSSITVTDSLGNTYVKDGDIDDGMEDYSGIWYWYLTSAPGPMTVTATNSNHENAGYELCVRVVMNAATNQTGGATVTKKNMGRTVYSSLVTTTQVGSWVYCACAANTSLTLTPYDANTTTIDSQTNTAQNGSAITGRQAGPTSSAGPITLGWSGTGAVGENNTFVAFEVLPLLNPGGVTGIGTPTQANSTSGSVTAVWGSGQGRTAGNLLVAGVAAIGSTSAGAISTPSGWAKVDEANGTEVRSAFYWRLAAGADAAPSFTSTLSGTYQGMSVTMWELNGAYGASPVATYGTGADLTANPLTVTTSANVPAAGCFAASCHANYRSTTAANAWTKDAAWSNDTSNGASSQRPHAAFDHYLSPPSGAPLACGGTWANAPTYEAGMSVVFRPVPSIPPPPAPPPSRAIWRSFTW